MDLWDSSLLSEEIQHCKHHKNYFKLMGAGNGIWDKCNIIEYLTRKERLGVLIDFETSHLGLHLRPCRDYPSMDGSFHRGYNYNG